MLGGAVDQPEPRHVPVEGRERDVGGERLRQRESQLTAVLGQVRDPLAHRLPRRADHHRPAVELHAADLRRRDPEERERDVGPPGADQAGEAQHLAPVDLEAHAGEDAVPPDPGDAEGQLAPRMFGSCKELRHLPADHVLDRPLGGDLGPGSGGDEPAVAQHGHAVGDLEHLVEPVADEQHGHAARGEVANLPEELGHLVGREGRGGLVHDEHAHVQGHGLGDLDGLLGRHGQTAGQAAHIEVDVEPGEDGLGLAVHPAPADHDPSVPVAHEDVLGDIEVGIDRRLLVDGGDPVPLRVGRAAQRDLLAVDEDRPLVRRVDPGHDLDERRLAGPVLAHQRMDLARVEGQGDASERLGGVEPLGDVDHLQHRDAIGKTTQCSISVFRPPVLERERTTAHVRACNISHLMTQVQGRSPAWPCRPARPPP